MMRIVVTTIAGVAFCAFQSGCCCCRLPMFAGRPVVLNPPVAGPMQAAVSAVQKLGGSVKQDDALPDRPVVEVSLNFTKATDGDLKNLTPFTNLRKLVLTQDQNITGTGLKDLVGL